MDVSGDGIARGAIPASLNAAAKKRSRRSISSHRFTRDAYARWGKGFA
jgi:hypothetical protein